MTGLELNLFHFLLFGASFFALLLSITLFIKGVHISSKYIALLSFSYAADLFIEGINTTTYIYIYPDLIGLIDPILFLFGPLVYFMTRSLLFLQDKAIPFIGHVLPFAIILILYSIFFFPLSEEVKLASEGLTLDVSEPNIYIHFRDTFHVLATVQELIYIILSLQLVNKFDQEKKYEQSFLHMFVWLKQLLQAALLLSCIQLSILPLIILDYFPFETLLLVLLLGSAFIVFFIGYRFIQNPERSNPHPNTSLKTKSQPLLNHKDVQVIKSTLTQAMKSSTYFLNPTLKIGELAKALNIPAHHLSYVINSEYNQHFFDFINSYRIEKAKQDLKDKTKSHLTILAISQDVGFSSKSAFNDAFKKFTGTTPSSYRKQV